ncbi:MAG: phosphate transport system regulatory protein PhoU [Chloroflexi bacterium]|nr:MAG: phosphate transport system regulatory protein PhoU [Anaerolineaceae bacterium 4572_32.1]RLC91685.1 MAG: phosphate transport system regulatory protein PhoU [Chloroflexota bacterium]
MPRQTFELELGHLEDEVLILGSMTEKAITSSVEALKKRDQETARQIIAADFEINHKRFEIEEESIQLVATQQPMAGDLRTIVAVLHIIVDLERMADHAEGIARVTLRIGDEPLLKPLIDIPRMAEKGVSMLRRALAAFIERDAEAAMQIGSEDNEVDNLYDQVYRELLTFMIADPRTINRATSLLWVAHNLERIADRVTNICERVVYMVTGQMEEMNVKGLGGDSIRQHTLPPEPK